MSGIRFAVGVRGLRVAAEVITVAVRWYLRYGLSYRDIEDCWPNAASGAVALTDLRRVTAGSAGEVSVRLAYVAAITVGLRRFPVSGRGDRVGGALVSRCGLSYRDVEELLAERGIDVDHVTVYRWVQRFTPVFADAVRRCRHWPGDRWFVDETYVKVNGVWRWVYRAVDQHGQIIDILVSRRRDGQAARRFFARALTTLNVTPTEVVTDAAPVYLRILDELVLAAWHHVEQYANNRIEADHSRLKHRLRPMRGLRTDPHRCGHHRRTRVRAEPSPRPLRTRNRHCPALAGRPAFTELAQAI